MDKKKFFISYNKSDEEKAKWIAYTLEKNGYTTIIQCWDFKPGQNFVVEMHNASIISERTIAVLSDNYLESLYCQAEWATAFSNDPSGDRRPLIPIRVSECTPQGLLKTIIYSDIVGLSEEEATETLLKSVTDTFNRIAPKFQKTERSSNEKLISTEVISGTSGILLHSLGDLIDNFLLPFNDENHFAIFLDATVSEVLLEQMLKNCYTRVWIPKQSAFAKTIPYLSYVQKRLVTIFDPTEAIAEALSIMAPIYREFGYRKIGFTKNLTADAEVDVDLVGAEKFGKAFWALDGLTDNWIPFFVAMKYNLEVDTEYERLRRCIGDLEPMCSSSDSRGVLALVNILIKSYRGYSVQSLSINNYPNDKAIVDALDILKDYGYMELSSIRKSLGKDINKEKTIRAFVNNVLSFTKSSKWNKLVCSNTSQSTIPFFDNQVKNNLCKLGAQEPYLPVIISAKSVLDNTKQLLSNRSDNIDTSKITLDIIIPKDKNDSEDDINSKIFEADRIDFKLDIQ